MRGRIALIAVGVGLLAGLGQAAQARVYVPTPKAIFEVRTPQGDLRSYQRPGLPPTYWDQSFPAIRGDQVTVVPLVATGGAELGTVTISLDGTVVATLTAAPWRAVVDTGKLADGDHVVEVKAKTAPPHAREGATKVALQVVPPDERMAKLTADGGETEEERLSAVIGCLDPAIDQALDAGATATLAEAESFHASAGPAAKDFFYTLGREGKVFYTSPLLPITTFVRLEPEGAAPPAPAAAPEKGAKDQKAVAPPLPRETMAGQGMLLAPGEVLLTLQVSNGEGRFGPPVWATLVVQPEAAAPGEGEQ